MEIEYWEKLLPMALECGMTPTQFWKGEPRLVKSYLIKHKMELDEYNYKSWLLNLYTFSAVSTAIGLAFADKKDKDKIKYLEKPIEDLYLLNKPKKEKVTNLNDKYREKVNYWSKFAKRGGKNG